MRGDRAMVITEGMGDRIWSVGDVCYVDGEGDEVFVIEEVDERWAVLFGHGNEPRSKLIALDEGQLAGALESLVTRIAVLEVHAVQVQAAVMAWLVAAHCLHWYQRPFRRLLLSMPDGTRLIEGEL